MIPLHIIHSESSDSLKYKTPQKAFYYSAIPGAGQIYNDKYIKGISIMLFEIYCINSWIVNKNKFDNYSNLNLPLNESRYLSKRNKFAWWVGFIYFYAMIDAIIDAHLSPFDDVMDSKIETEIDNQNNQNIILDE